MEEIFYVTPSRQHLSWLWVEDASPEIILHLAAITTRVRSVGSYIQKCLEPNAAMPSCLGRSTNARSTRTRFSMPVDRTRIVSRHSPVWTLPLVRKRHLFSLCTAIASASRNRYRSLAALRTTNRARHVDGLRCRHSRLSWRSYSGRARLGAVGMAMLGRISH